MVTTSKGVISMNDIDIDMPMFIRQLNTFADVLVAARTPQILAAVHLVHTTARNAEEVAGKLKAEIAAVLVLRDVATEVETQMIADKVDAMPEYSHL